MADAIELALRFDPLSHAEKLTDNSYKSDKETELLGIALHFSHGQMKRELLRNAGDTYWAMPMSEWVAVVESMGFEMVLEIEIPGTKDLYRMWWLPGILLCADTFGNNSLNSANAHFDYLGPRDALSGSSGHGGAFEGQDFWHASIDAREGFRHKIEKMMAAGRFLPEWNGPRFLWLLHYMDAKKDGYEYEKINAERIAMLPSHVRAAIAKATGAARATEGGA